MSDDHPTYFPVFDGKLSDDPNVINVLLPTKENIAEMKRRGAYLYAFRLLCDDIWAKADNVFRDAGFAFEARGREEELRVEPAFYAAYLADLEAWAASRNVVMTGPLGVAADACHYLKFLSDLLAGLDEDDPLAIACMASVSLGFAGRTLQAPVRALLSAEVYTLSEFQRRNQGKSVEVKTTWREPTLARAKELLASEGWLSNSKLALRLIEDKVLEAARLKQKCAPLPDRPQLASWVGKERKAKRLPEATAKPQV